VPATHKKVLFIGLTAFSRTGGVEKFNKCFLKALQDLESETDLSSFSMSLYDDKADEKYFANKKYNGFGGNKLSFVVSSILKAKNFDIIFIGHINLAIVGFFIKLFFPRKKLILIAHGYEVWSPLKGFKKALVNKADLILAVSNFTKNKLVEVQKIESGKISLFHNTIDPFFIIPSNFKKSEHLKERYGIEKDDFVMYTLARLSAAEGYKGYDVVIKCLPQLAQSIPNIKYVIAGKYDVEEKNRLDKLIEEKGVSNKVIFAGFLKDSEVESHYQMGDLFIMPSMGEGFGIVFIEAMACGMPVIAGNADGSVDALKDGELGALVNPNSENDITEKVEDIFQKKEMITDPYKYDLQQRTLKHFGFEQYKKNLQHFIFHNN